MASDTHPVLPAARTKLASRLGSLPLHLILAAGPFILLAPVYLTGRALYWGTPLLQFVPWWHTAVEFLRQGDLPLWNPLLGMGAPLLANYQSALLYPPYWVLLLLGAAGGPAWMAWGQALVVAFHLALAGFGMARLARRLGLGTLAQVTSGLAFGLSGYLVSRSIFPSINASAAWAPWILAGVWDVFQAAAAGERQTWRAWLKSLLPFTLPLAFQLLAGHAQTAWYTLLLAGMWVVYLVLSRGMKWQERGRLAGGLLARLAAGGLLAGTLAAAQLIPTAEYLLVSQRAEQVDYDFAMNYSTWPWRFLGLFFPEMFGSPVRGDFWGYAAFWEDALYLGLLPLLLALAALLRLRRTPEGFRLPGSSFKLFALLVILLSAIFALGRNTPIFPWLYAHVPSFDMFQAPARYLLWAQLMLAVLAGVGAQSWRQPEGRGLYWTRLATAGAFSVTLGAFLALYFLGDIRPTYIWGFALAGLWGLGAGVLSLLAPLHLGAYDVRSRLWRWGVAAWICTDLLVAGWGQNPGVDLDVYRLPASTAAEVRAALDEGRLFLSAEDEDELKFGRYLSFQDFRQDGDWTGLRNDLLPNANLLDMIPTTSNFDPLVPGRYRSWMQAVEGAPAHIQAAALNLMGVRVVERVYADQVEFISMEAGPRARFMPCAQGVDSPEEALAVLQGSGLDWQTTVVVESPPSLPAGCASRAAGQVGWVVNQPNRILLTVQAPVDGWLLLSDTYYPGWRARVDGRPQEIYAANSLFRAVPVAAGSHQVEFVYQPLSFWAGLAASVGGWLLILVLWKGSPAKDRFNG
jgi:hypothetical protein